MWRLWFSTLHSAGGVRAASILIFNGNRLWRLPPSNSSQAFCHVWRLWFQSIHTQTVWKSTGNAYCVKEWMLFWGNKNGIHARARRQEHTITSKPYASSPASFGISLNWIIQIESAHTVGGLFFPTRRVKKNSSPLAHHNSPNCRTSATKGNQGLIVRAPEICTSCKEILQGRSQREKPATPPQHWATQP